MPAPIDPAAAARLLAVPAVAAVMAILNAEGEEARLVGGAVRDACLGLPPDEIDIATTAPPAIVMARAARAGLKALPTGIDHGTVTLIVAGAPVEVTTLRRDVTTDGRRAVVAFTRDFIEDAARRDFTINALSLDGDGRLHDPTGGLADLAARRIRFIGDAERRIREDYLRILRFFRFHARFGGTLDPVGLAACTALGAGLDTLARERVRQELVKLLVAPHAADAVTIMARQGLLARIVPGARDGAVLERLVAFWQRVGADPVAMVALAALVAPGAVGHLHEALRLSTAERERLETADRDAEMFRATPTWQTALSLYYRGGAEGLRDALALAAARGTAEVGDKARDQWSLPDRMDRPRLPFSGGELLRLGEPPGPRLGAILAEAERLWIAAGLPDDPAAHHRLLAAARLAVTP